MPSYPTFDRNPLDLADDARRRGPAGRRARRRRAEVRPAPLRQRGPGRARELPPRAVDLAGEPARARPPRATSTSSSTCSAPTPRCAPPRRRRACARATWCGTTRRPTGKLDLLLTLDFRMTSTTIFSDVVLPAATWYEKHDLNTTDMHPFVHSFNPAISPPWQTRTDWDAFMTISAALQRARRDPPRRAPGRRRRPADARHPRRAGHSARRGRATGRPASASRCRA